MKQKRYLYRTAYTHSLKTELPSTGGCLVKTNGESKSLQRILLQQGFVWASVNGYYHPLTNGNYYYICWNRSLYIDKYTMTWTSSSSRVPNAIIFENYFKPLKKFRGLNMKRFGI